MRRGVYGFSRRFAPNNPQSLLGGVLHNIGENSTSSLFCYTQLFTQINLQNI